MSTTVKPCLKQLMQMALVNVDKWKGGYFDPIDQQQLLAALRNDPLVTELE